MTTLNTPAYYYNMVAGLATVNSRTERGACGSLTLEGNWDGFNWLSKQDKKGMPVDYMGRPMIYWEWQVLCSLQGLGIVPTVDTETSPLEYGKFYIECVNNAATLGDYISAYLEGILPFEIIKEILLISKETIDKFHGCDYVHNDLHCNNLVVGYGRTGWKVYLIDVALATYQGEVPDWMDTNFSIKNCADEDLYYLSEDISSICGEYTNPILVEKLTLLVNRLF